MYSFSILFVASKIKLWINHSFFKMVLLGFGTLQKTTLGWGATRIQTSFAKRRCYQEAMIKAMIWQSPEKLMCCLQYYQSEGLLVVKVAEMAWTTLKSNIRKTLAFLSHSQWSYDETHTCKCKWRYRVSFGKQEQTDEERGCQVRDVWDVVKKRHPDE